MSLQDIPIKAEYRSFRDDIAKDFYMPLLRQAICYQRAVGFFSSTILSRIADGLYEFYQHDGKIQLLASPKLSQEDITAIREGYAIRQQVITQALTRELLDYDDFHTNNRLNLLANLIAEGRLDIKIVVPAEQQGLGMYHEKIGLITDAEENIVAFSGSMNESSNALEQNYESFDVFCSWKPEDRRRVFRKRAAFSELWSDLDPHATVRGFPEVQELFVEKYHRGPVAQNPDLYQFPLLTRPSSVKESGAEEIKSAYLGFRLPADLQLFDYQQDAIKAWREHSYRGIFDMATGTGKTLTGLGALAALCQEQSRLGAIIVCPFQHLVNQWVEDIVKFHVQPIIAYSTSPQRNYKERIKKAVFSFNLGVTDFFCLVCTNATFATTFVQEQLSRLKGPSVLVVDEAHNFGAANLSRTLQRDFTYRLALSATLDRHHDPEGTDLLHRFFGEVCIHYGLDRAIADKKLVPYYYHPIVVYLTTEELERYQLLTWEIGKNIYKNKDKVIVTPRAKKLLLQRARLVAGAAEKITKLRDMMQQFQHQQDMLIYCGATTVDVMEDGDQEAIRQIDYICRMLNVDFGMRTARFTSQESNELRQLRIEEFKGHDLQALVAIKCLDEGVNIPSIRTAFILASTTNPKEYIQRRGRVLRRYPGKDHADIYDFVTLPRPLDEVVNSDFEQGKHELSLVKNELNRIVAFQELAFPSYETDCLVENIKEAYHLFETPEFVDEQEEWEQ